MCRWYLGAREGTQGDPQISGADDEHDNAPGTRVGTSRSRHRFPADTDHFGPAQSALMAAPVLGAEPSPGALIGLAPAWPPIAGWTTPDPHTRARFQTVSPRSPLLTGTATGAVAARPIMLTDFSVCTPRAALATKPDPDHWQLIEYQADGVSGTMIGAKSLVTAPDVVLPLGVAGWHQIHVGYWNPYFEYDGELLLRLKLSGDSCFDRIQEGPPGEPAEQVHPGRTSLVEVFWRAEDLTGRHLTLGKFKGRKAYVASVKLVPMSPEEVAKVKRERQRKRPRRVVGSIDGAGIWGTYYGNTPTVEDLREMVEKYRDSDVGKIVWAVNYGDKTNYLSKFGILEAGIEEATLKNNDYTRIINPPQRALIDRGVSYHSVVAEHLHSMGIKFDVMIRPSLQYESPINTSRKGFVAEHPELRIRLANGDPVEKLSYAYPETRAFTLSIIREATEMFDADGVSICFVRMNLCMGWEPPVLAAFRAEGYQDKPRNVGATDSRIRKIRSEFLMQLMRDARKVLDEVGRKKGKRLELSASVWPHQGHRGWSPRFDVDYRAMMKEKLLDSVVVHQGEAADQEDLVIGHANGCRYFLFPDGGPAVAAQRLIEGYAEGIDGVAEWDINPDDAERWRFLKVGGSPEELERIGAAPLPAPQRKLITIHKINGMSVSGQDLWQSNYAGG